MRTSTEMAAAAPTTPARNTAVIDNSTGSPVPVVYSTNTVTQAANRDYAVPTYLAVRSSYATGTASVGYAGTASDGLEQLDTNRSLTTYNSAPNGHVTTTQDVTPGNSGDVTLAVGFGRTQAGALATARASLTRSFVATQAGYVLGWARYDLGLRRPPASYPGLSRAKALDLALRYYLSANVLKASEDKTYPGAIVASLASPWGQAVPRRHRGERQAGLLRLLPRGVLA